MPLSTDAKRAQLTPVLENYLEVIFRLEARDGAARASTIAEMAQVSRSTVTGALKTLKGLELVEYSPYSLIYLTEEGRDIGRKIAHCHFVFQAFLEKVLLLDTETSDTTACALEHVVPEQVILRLGEFVLFLKSRPDMWDNWHETFKHENIFSVTHTASTIAEILKAKRTRA